MKPTRLHAVLSRMLTLRWPVFLWGPPGIGKSAIVHQLAAEHDLPLRDLRASLLDPTDLRGIPSIVGGRAVWCPPDFLPGAHEPHGLLFLDEINAAPPLVQAALYQLVLDRRIGEYRLPEGWRIVAAGNRAHDRAVTFRLSSALANRFVHLDVDADPADWRAWAMQAGVSPFVIGFLGLRPELLCRAPEAEPAYPTPRSWHMLSDVLQAAGSLDACADVLPGIVGEGAAAEFLGYARTALREEDLQRLVDDPHGAPLPTALGDLYAMAAWFGHQGKDARVRAAGGVLLGRLPPEFAVMLARDLLKVHAGFLRDPGYKAFAARHAPLLAG